VAVFDPAFPGAFPFRVARPALAKALLQGIRHHARPEHGFVNLVIEADSERVEWLRSAGANARFEIVQYQGRIDGTGSTQGTVVVDPS
jgi:hypothetical protein